MTVLRQMYFRRMCVECVIVYNCFISYRHGLMSSVINLSPLQTQNTSTFSVLLMKL